MLRFACILLLAAAVSAGKVNLRPCGGSEDSIGSNVALDVAEFPDGTSMLQLKRGSKYNFKISFTSASDSETLTNKLFGTIGGIDVPWQGVEADACKGFNSAGNGCPLVSGKHYLYENFVEVAASYPTISLTITWKLVDANNKNQACFKIPARIVA